ncbi:hypothetical protein [uncultured Sphingomonas sp.]|uniref:hypothetical protein n=1 Tax=uncultured Sphingomonas sp. TaxID=158754 RepID=UPI0035CC8F38
MSIDFNDGELVAHPVLSHVPGARDPYGQAALLLIESLIHGLKERGVLTIAEAVDVIETAADVQYELADAADGAGSGLRHAASLLTAMALSLQGDMKADEER